MLSTLVDNMYTTGCVLEERGSLIQNFLESTSSKGEIDKLPRNYYRHIEHYTINSSPNANGNRINRLYLVGQIVKEVGSF